MSDLKSKIEEAKTKLGLSNQELSTKLGHQKRYITNALLDPSVKRQKEIILKIEALMLKESGDLTHDFEGKALNKFIGDAVMISKSEYESLQKEVSHKTQVAEKHNDMRAKAEAELQIANDAIKQQLTNVASKLLIIGNLENELKKKDELIILAEQDSEKWQHDCWVIGRENIELAKSKKAILIWLAVSILIIFAMVAFGVLHFNGVV